MELKIEELEEQGYKFYKRFKGLDFTNSDKNRNRNIKNNIAEKYEYVVQKRRMVKGIVIQEAGIWLKIDESHVLIEECKTNQSVKSFKRLLDFFINNHTNYMTNKEIAKFTGTGESTISKFKKHCREKGILEPIVPPRIEEKYNPLIGEKVLREVPVMKQVYYISVTGKRNNKLMASHKLYSDCWKWIYKRTDYLGDQFRKKNGYKYVTSCVYTGYKKKAIKEFKKVHGFIVNRENSNEIQFEVLHDLGIDFNLNRTLLPTKKIYDETGIKIQFSMIENDVNDICKEVEVAHISVDEHLAEIQSWLMVNAQYLEIGLRLELAI